MKKLSLLVMPLMAMSFLVSCDNGGGNKPGEVKFSLLSDQPIKVLEDNKTAEVSVDWTPNDIIRFESFTFDATPTKDNTVTFDPTSYPRPMTVKITFTKDITEDISGTLSFKYEDVTTKTKGEGKLNVTIPKPEDDPTVTKEEFDRAISFEGVQFLQVEETVVIDPEEPTATKIYEFSPSVMHRIIDLMEDETYVRKCGTNPVTYDECYKDFDTSGFIFAHNVDASLFTTPQTYCVGSFEKNLLGSIKELLGDDYYSCFNYIKEQGIYKAESGDNTIILEFKDKKVVGYDFDVENEHYYDVTARLEYEEITPEYPVEPYVNEEEFNNACSLVGVQLLQVAQRTIINSGEGGFIQDTNIKISDLVYYLSQATDREGEMYDYFVENYAKINQLGDTTCIYTFRDNNEQTDWSTPVTAEAKQYCIRPEDCNPLLIKDMTGYECNPSLTYEKFEPVEGKYIYTGKATYLSGDPYDAKMELTFANKKLTHCLFTVDDDWQYQFECTYKYENIVPVWPL